ncbi:MAG: hypothetical protein GQ553_02575 [Nitrosomonadaceae bacterium]|nr:hypothetical protein [Nitrosomonadaceae bacterium]
MRMNLVTPVWANVGWKDITKFEVVGFVPFAVYLPKICVKIAEEHHNSIGRIYLN